MSCSTKKDILYMQDTIDNNSYEFDYTQYRVKVDDILKIEIGAETPEPAAVFNQSLNMMNNNTLESMLYNGYQVDSNGYINFPVIGKIFVSQKNISEIRDDIYNLIVEKKILIAPSVDVKLMNSHFTILGEVKNPGKYDFLRNNMNILNAIGMAGDLTINGERRDIKIIRENEGKSSVSFIDLTKSDFLTGSNFQIFSGDIIIVNPNSTRVKNAGIIGNSGTLLSLLSFILSSIIVISN